MLQLISLSPYKREVPKKFFGKNVLLVTVVCTVVAPQRRRCQKSGNDYRLVQDVDGGPLGGANRDSRSAHHQR
jgi:hypothetical protein